MISISTRVALGICAMSLGFAPHARAQAPTAQARSCADRAAQQGLRDKGRDAFVASCERGSLEPKHPLAHRRHTQAAKTITDPSGADPKVRSADCNAEAGRRGLKEGAFQAFRKGCLASAAPVRTIQTSKTAEAPTKEQPKLDALTDAPAHR